MVDDVICYEINILTLVFFITLALALFVGPSNTYCESRQSRTGCGTWHGSTSATRKPFLRSLASMHPHAFDREFPMWIFEYYRELLWIRFSMALAHRRNLERRIQWIPY